MFRKKPPKLTTGPSSVDQAQLSAEAAAFPPIGSTLPTSYYQGQAAPSVDNAAMKTQTHAKSKRDIKKIIKRALITLLIIGFIGGSYIGVKLLINASKSLNGNLFGLLQSQKLKGEAEGRVNILLAGNSADDPGHKGGNLTDSILIVSIDTKNKTAFMLSIPRDLWVEVPNQDQYQKINAVYEYGKSDNFREPGYPAGGMGALEKVLSTKLGIPLHYYALVNYTAFRDAVNAVGGIDVTIASSDPRGLYDAMIARADGGPLKLSNGLQHLNGQTALNLARARGSGYSYGFPSSDFNRTEHQRLMLVALKSKAVSAGVLANPIKIGKLFDSFGNNVVTDFKTSEVRRLYDVTKDIPDNSIKSIGLNAANGKNLLRSYNGRGQSALIPAKGIDDYSDISAFLDTLLAPPPPATDKSKSTN